MISKYKRDSEFYTSERCYIIEIHNREEDEECSVARARVPVGVTTQLHALQRTAERYVILDGEGRMEVGGGQATTVRPMDVVFIPQGATQRITNTGRRDLIFLAICTPRFRPEAYVDSEPASQPDQIVKGDQA